jgi:NADH-quinone oxidoreductase subunit L
MLHANDILLLATGFVFGGFLIIAGSTGRSATAAAYVSIGSLVAALAGSIVAIIRRLGHSGNPGQGASHALLFSWLQWPATAGYHRVAAMQWGVSSGALNLAFFMMFLLVLLLTQVHALALLKSRTLRPAYFAISNLAAFFMLMGALAINVVQMYLSLELAAFAAWYLIGYTSRPAERITARKILLPLWIADALFIAGIAIFTWHGSPVDHQILFGHAPLSAGSSTELLIPFFSHWLPGLTWRSLGGVCLVAGALAKAGQFPFHTWFPETITGFSSCNAMLAGTLVAASGVMLLARMLGLLNLNAELTVAMMGATAQFCAGLMALVQKDIKRALAWLLIGQTGLNFLFFGSGDYASGLLGALLTGLVFTGLFLAAGTVLRANGGQRDMTLLGGAWRRLPITAAVTAVLVVMDAGAGFSGMTAVVRNGLLHAHGYAWAIGEFGRFLFWCPVLMSYVMALALARWWWLVFAGKSRPGASGMEEGELAVQTFPLLVILVGTLIAGQPFIDLAGLLGRLLVAAPVAAAHIPAGLSGMMLRPLAWLGPAALAVVALIYAGGLGVPDTLRRTAGVNLIYRWLMADMYFPDLIIAIFGFPVRCASRVIAFIDRWAVEWLLVTLSVLMRMVSIFVVAAENALNSSMWERHGRSVERILTRLDILRRRHTVTFMISGVVVLVIVALLAALLHV